MREGLFGGGAASADANSRRPALTSAVQRDLPRTTLHELNRQLLQAFWDKDDALIRRLDAQARRSKSPESYSRVLHGSLRLRYGDAFYWYVGRHQGISELLGIPQEEFASADSLDFCWFHERGYPLNSGLVDMSLAAMATYICCTMRWEDYASSRAPALNVLCGLRGLSGAELSYDTYTTHSSGMRHVCEWHGCQSPATYVISRVATLAMHRRVRKLFMEGKRAASLLRYWVHKLTFEHLLELTEATYVAMRHARFAANHDEKARIIQELDEKRAEKKAEIGKIIAVFMEVSAPFDRESAYLESPLMVGVGEYVSRIALLLAPSKKSLAALNGAMRVPPLEHSDPYVVFPFTVPFAYLRGVGTPGWLRGRWDKERSETPYYDYRGSVVSMNFLRELGVASRDAAAVLRAVEADLECIQKQLRLVAGGRDVTLPLRSALDFRIWRLQDMFTPRIEGRDLFSHLVSGAWHGMGRDPSTSSFYRLMHHMGVSQEYKMVEGAGKVSVCEVAVLINSLSGVNTKFGTDLGTTGRVVLYSNRAEEELEVAMDAIDPACLASREALQAFLSSPPPGLTIYHATAEFNTFLSKRAMAASIAAVCSRRDSLLSPAASSEVEVTFANAQAILPSLPVSQVAARVEVLMELKTERGALPEPGVAWRLWNRYGASALNLLYAIGVGAQAVNTVVYTMRFSIHRSSELATKSFKSVSRLTTRIFPFHAVSLGFNAMVAAGACVLQANWAACGWEVGEAGVSVLVSRAIWLFPVGYALPVSALLTAVDVYQTWQNVQQLREEWAGASEAQLYAGVIMQREKNLTQGGKDDELGRNSQENAKALSSECLVPSGYVSCGGAEVRDHGVRTLAQVAEPAADIAAIDAEEVGCPVEVIKLAGGTAVAACGLVSNLTSEVAPV